MLKSTDESITSEHSVSGNIQKISEKYGVNLKAINVVSQINELSQKKILTNISFVVSDQLPDKTFATECKFSIGDSEFILKGFGTCKKQSKSDVCEQIIDMLIAV